MGQMIPINLPADGNWPTIVGDSIMIIGPRQNELTEEQRYFNPVYLMVYPGKEHLKAQMIRAGACDCDPTIPNRRIGVFSVAPDKKVSFSQGNLQYLPAINLWKFADTQYEYLGNANKYLKPTFRNWVDLFGWSANNTTAPFGVSTSTNVADYAGDFVDWGTNAICGDAPNTWRTLSIEEWKYLYHERKNAEKLFALGTINGIAGMILLPDDWQLPEGATCQLPTEKGLLWDDNYNGGGYINTNTQANHYQDNIYTLEQWQVMEEAGAVFLPAAGYRENTNFSTQSVNPPSDYVGSYATSTIADKNNYYFMRFIHREVRKYSHSLYRGRAVRLVHDTIVPRTIPKRIGVFSVAADKQVSFSQGNLQYIQSMKTWQFAENQQEYIGAANVNGGALADKIDLFGWSASNTTAPFGVSTSTNAADYAGDFVDWGTNAICGDAPGTWRTLNMEEWEYLFEQRKNALQLRSKGSINGHRGHILLPDDWVLPEGAQFVAEPDNLTMELDINTYTPAEWSIMEEAGAVFLPATGRRDGTTVGYLVEYSGVWSSTSANTNAYHTYYNYESQVIKHRCTSATNRINGRSVRLVHDTIVPRTIPKRIGVFSVAADKQVSFSQGNLQYIQSTKTWKFAKEQYAYMGEKHYRNGQLADTIEYFGWSGKNSKTPWGISLSTESSDYEGEFLDWGTNTIAGSAPNTWRTLSNDEWLYICQGRKNADQLLGLGKISSIFGLIILPDDWVAPEGITFTPNNNNPNANVYSLQQWTAMEEAGAIFIPPTGYFNHDIDNMRYVGTYGYARNNTLTANGLQIYTLFKPSEIQYSRSAQGNNENLYYAFPQRLVHDTIVPKPEPEYVDLGLSVKWAIFNVGATSPEDYGDYFAWGETEPKEKYSWTNYKWCNGTDRTMTKYCTNSQYGANGFTDGKTILEPEDDAAQVQWGDKWRMPTKDEMQELFDNCTWTEETRNGINGYIVTGPNGNSIFLPRAGFYNYDEFGDGLQYKDIRAYYWTNTRTIDLQGRAYDLGLNTLQAAYGIVNNTRRLGFPIRPVYDDRPQ